VAPDMSAVPLSMTPDQREAAVNAVNGYWATLNTGNADTDNQLLLAFIRSRTTEFADAGITPDHTVWARFIDGLPTLFADRTVPDGTVLPNLASNRAMLPGVTPSAQLPQGDQAVLIDVDLLAANSLSTIGPALTAKNYVVSQPPGSVSDFLAIQNVSVLFISSHGSYAVTKSGTPTYVVMTNERAQTFDPNNAHHVSLRALSDTEELLVSTVRLRNNNGQPISQPGTFFWISAKFVSNNWQFTPHSLVVLDSCDMFLDQHLSVVADQAAYQDFRAALTSKNAGNIVGWDGMVSPAFASNVMQRFFDRTLGANAYQPETPRQRPFPYHMVYDWLVSTDQHSEANGGTLRLQQATTGQLVPTLHNALVYYPAQGSEHAGEWVLEIAGEFGTDVGVVSVGGTALALLEPWDNSRLVAALPPSMNGPGSHGDLVVTVRNHPSNAVPLTKWTGTISQTQIGTDIGEGARFDISCPVQGTTDVHAPRGQPAATPQRLSALVLELTGPCSYTLSGTWIDGTTRYDLSGTGSVTPVNTIPVVGGASSSGSSAALPAPFQGSVGPILLAPGNLRVTDTTDNSFYDDPVSGSWAFATGTVTLGANYSFTANRLCQGPTTCTETWSLTPAAAPTVDTES